MLGLLVLLGHVFLSLAVFLLATQDKGFKKLILSLDLLIVLLHCFEALDELVDTQIFKINVVAVQVSYLVAHLFSNKFKTFNYNILSAVCGQLPCLGLNSDAAYYQEKLSSGIIRPK